ncbi:dihydrodipicolinate reductase [Skermanella stibiiresistens SB22]|uniref:4-hydroxy-tetrahydrodipicolinate reductase n=1 Tax=Skermanella stibiiresistens SB22 TaxID=1385369 RepID=W9GVP6_9PROT|nr:4-hydroxy-tetrahydrodipicolinate reductase [Skermanella stibiiresistens]EWY37975.1 dihydrodipicolinate reductase [Skermanella stibiiresistens SB22]
MKIGVVGCAGRMGQMLVRRILVTAGCELAGGTDRAGSEAIGRDIAGITGLDPIGMLVTDDPVQLFADADAVIDFTSPNATERHAALAAQAKTVHIVGTTGLNPGQIDALRKAAQHTAIVHAPNMSLGVNLLMVLVEQVSRTLGPDFDIEIVEMHHRHKVDAPSGTSLGLGRAAAAGRGVDLDAVAARVRDGHTGERRRGDIGFAVMRGGDVVGDHSVVFAGEGERIELGHRAGDRGIYAVGAVRAALWAHGKPPGLYSMRDVLALG